MRRCDLEHIIRAAGTIAGDTLIPILNENTNGVTGYCLEIHDLAFSKYVAWRPKDIEFTRLLAKFGMTSKTRLLELANNHSQPTRCTEFLEPRILRDFT
jgi:hypothetical protein